MELNGFLDERKNLLLGLARCDAPRKVRHISAIAAWSLFNHNHVTHKLTPYSSPACFNALLSVPGGTSTLGLPATVTVPGFEG